MNIGISDSISMLSNVNNIKYVVNVMLLNLFIIYVKRLIDLLHIHVENRFIYIIFQKSVYVHIEFTYVHECLVTLKETRRRSARGAKVSSSV